MMSFMAPGDGMQEVGCMECLGHFVAFDDPTLTLLDEDKCCQVLSSASIPDLEFQEIINNSIDNLLRDFHNDFHHSAL